MEHHAGSIKDIYLNIPEISIKKVINDDLSVIYYELYFNKELEGRYQSISSVNWRVGLMISEEALSVEE